MSRLTTRWRAYWFRPAPLLDLAVCRLALVGFQVAYLVFGYMPVALSQRVMLAEGLYEPLPVLRLLTPWGWQAGLSWVSGPWGWLPPLDAVTLVHGGTVVAGLLALIGWKTRPALAVFALGNLWLHAYMHSFNDIHHPEGLMVLALLVLAASPAGGALSVDAARRPAAGLSEMAGWPLLVIRWLLAMAYFSGALSKLATAGMGWMDGHTLQFYLLRDALFYEMPMGLWFAQQHGLAVALSWVTIWFEGTFWLVLLAPVLAWVYVPAGLALHTGIYLTMRAPFFQWMVLYAAFIPWSVLAQALARRRVQA